MISLSFIIVYFGFNFNLFKSDFNLMLNLSNSHFKDSNRMSISSLTYSILRSIKSLHSLKDSLRRNLEK